MALHPLDGAKSRKHEKNEGAVPKEEPPSMSSDRCFPVNEEVLSCWQIMMVVVKHWCLSKWLMNALRLIKPSSCDSFWWSGDRRDAAIPAMRIKVLLIDSERWQDLLSRHQWLPSMTWSINLCSRFIYCHFICNTSELTFSKNRRMTFYVFISNFVFHTRIYFLQFWNSFVFNQRAPDSRCICLDYHFDEREDWTDLKLRRETSFKRRHKFRRAGNPCSKPLSRFLSIVVFLVPLHAINAVRIIYGSGDCL